MGQDDGETNGAMVIQRIRDRIEHILEDLEPRIPAEVMEDVSRGFAEIALLAEEAFAALTRTPDAGQEKTLSIFEAAQQLFVTPQHVTTLVDDGSLPLYHQAGERLFVREADVVAYRERKRTQAKAWIDTQTEDTNPPGL